MPVHWINILSFKQCLPSYAYEKRYFSFNAPSGWALFDSLAAGHRPAHWKDKNLDYTCTEETRMTSLAWQEVILGAGTHRGWDINVTIEIFRDTRTTAFNRYTIPSTDISASHFQENRHSTYKRPDGCGGVRGRCTDLPCEYCHSTFTSHWLIDVAFITL